MTEPFLVTRAALPLPGLPEALRGLKILHLSDLHNMRFGEKNADLANAVLAENPDAIFMTGDMCDGRSPEGGGALTELLSSLGGRFPVYLCSGNHEDASACNFPEEYADFLRRVRAAGAVPLEDSHIRVRLGSGDVYVFGFSFLPGMTSVKAIRERLGECPDDAPVFVLCHHPKWFDALEEWGAAAVFSGHIHGGLIRLPLLGGVLSPSLRLFPRYDKGIFHLPGGAMHLSAGFGDTALGFRFNNPREACLLTLETRKPEAQAGQTYAAGRIPRVVCGSVFAAVAALSLLSPAAGVFHAGVPPAFLFFALPAAALLYPPLLTKPLRRRRWRAARRWAVRLYALCAAVFLAISVWMVSAAVRPAPANAPLIILGCQVRGTQPSRMLQRRIGAALRYLQENPGAVAVASGGQGKGEDIPEALAIRDALVAAGIDPARIQMEGASANTRENIAFSAELLGLDGENPDVVIATDELHQLRAALWAEKSGLRAAPAPSCTPWYLFSGYWFREALGNLRLLLLGH